MLIKKITEGEIQVFKNVSKILKIILCLHFLAIYK